MLGHIADSSSANWQRRERLGEFLSERHQLLATVNQGALPVGEINDWVERMNTYLRAQIGESYATRLSDFSGFTFYDDSSQQSQMKRAIDGRLRRLNEFMSELR